MHRIILIILAQAIKMFYLKLNYEMNLSSEILSFFIRQEMGNTSTCNLRNKMCITFINDYVQLPLLSGKKFSAAPYCLPGTTQLGEMRYRFHCNCLFLIIFALAIILINLNVNCKSNLSKEILIFFLRQEIIAPAMSLTISRNKICVIIKQYYMQLPLWDKLQRPIVQQE